MTQGARITPRAERKAPSRYADLDPNTEKRRLLSVLLLGGLLNVLVYLVVSGAAESIRHMDSVFADSLLHSREQSTAQPRVVLVDVDEQSLAAVGQWPWPRYRLAALLETLAKAKPAVIGLDILFSEPDRASVSSMREAFKREFGLNITINGLPKPLEDNDAYLGHVLSRAPAVGSVMFLKGYGNLRPSCSLPALSIRGALDALQIPEPDWLLCNVPPIQSGLAASGSINIAKDPDGVLRRMPLLTRYRGKYYPSLDLAALMLFVGADRIEVTDGFFGPSLRIKHLLIPVDRQGAVLLRFEGAPDGLHMNALDVLTEQFDPATLQDRIVMVGSSASGLNDLHHTAVASGLPGLQAHAALCNGVLAANPYREPVWGPQYAMGASIAAGIAVCLLFCLNSPLAIGLGVLGILTLFPALGIAAFKHSGVLLPVTGPVLSGAVLLTGLSLWLYIRERRLARLRVEKLVQVKQATLESMVAVAETRDIITGGHIKRTQAYVKILAEGLRDDGTYPWITQDFIEMLYLSAPLHDVGKVAIADNILCKPGKLTGDEFSLMQKHVLFGRQIIEKAAQAMAGDIFLDLAAEMAYTHHEKWDGSGYFQGLSGQDIPLSGRIMALADVYDALVSKRPYKPKYAHSVAKAIILQGSGSHFDPAVVEVFCREEQRFLEISETYVDD